MVEILIAAAWVIDAGALLYFARVLARNGTHWQGAPTIITMMVLFIVAIVVSSAMVLSGETRSTRVTALAIAGALPLIGGLAFGCVGLIVAVAALFGGRMN